VTCRCQRDAPVHLCHGGGYTCPRPGVQRFYGGRLVALAGVQMKAEMRDTWACDECWAMAQVRRGGG
jgi:hypothetical protein